VMNLLRTGFQSVGSLDSFLGGKGISYHTLAGTLLATIETFEVPRGFPTTTRENFVRCSTGRRIATKDDFRVGTVREGPNGDGTVPLYSAQFLPPGTNIVVPTPFPGVPHGKLLQDLRVRNYCYTQIGLPAVTRESDEELAEETPLGHHNLSPIGGTGSEASQLITA
jgi:hypothetical protein